jgi:putative membrane protein
MKNSLLAVLLLAGLVLAGCSQNRANPKEEGDNQNATTADNRGGENDQRSGGASDKLAASDEEFAHKAATGSKAEVELGNLALEKASSDRVKEFAQRMVTDHGQASQQLQQIASNRKLELPQMMPTEAQEQHDKLSRLSGAQFDREYMRIMVQDHQKDIAEFQKAMNEVQDNDLKQFIQQTLPTMQEHLKMAQEIAGKR